MNKVITKIEYNCTLAFKEAVVNGKFMEEKSAIPFWETHRILFQQYSSQNLLENIRVNLIPGSLFRFPTLSNKASHSSGAVNCYRICSGR